VHNPHIIIKPATAVLNDGGKYYCASIHDWGALLVFCHHVAAVPKITAVSCPENSHMNLKYLDLLKIISFLHLQIAQQIKERHPQPR
jgi:hypothetical protein